MYNLPVRQTDWQTTSLYLVIAISFDTFKRKFLIRYSIMFSKTFKNVKGIIFVRKYQWDIFEISNDKFTDTVLEI